MPRRWKIKRPGEVCLSDIEWPSVSGILGVVGSGFSAISPKISPKGSEPGHELARWTSFLTRGTRPHVMCKLSALGASLW